MGLFDSLLGSVTAQAETSLAAQHPLVGVLGGLLTQNGGVQGLESKFQQGGLGGAFSSWVGTGANQAVSPDEIQRVLGSEQVTALAGKLGVDPAQASHFLAQYLPQIVDHLTPNGTVDPSVDHHQGLAGMLPMLLQSLGGGSPAAATAPVNPPAAAQ